MTQPPPAPSLSGPAYMIGASLAFAAMGTLVKAVSVAVPPGQVVFWRSGVAALVVLLVVARTRASLVPVNGVMHVVRGLTGVGSMVCYFTAISRLPLGDAVLVTYTSPLIVAVLSPWTVGERPPGPVWAALGLGVVGVGLVVGPHGAHDPIGLLAAVAAAGFAASAYLSVRVLTRTDSTTAIVFWFSVIGTLLPSLSFLEGPAPLTPALLAGLLGVGALGTLAQVFMTRAYARAEAARVSVYAYATPVFAYLLGLVVLGERPQATSLAGAALVLVAAWVARR